MARIVLDTAGTALGIGSSANDGTGDPIRTGASKLKQWAADLNTMTAEIYGDLPAAIQLVSTPLAAGAISAGGTSSAEENVIVFTTSKLDVNSQTGNQADAQRSDWRLSFGQALFNVTDSGDQVMALGYNVVGGGTRPNLSEIGLGFFLETDYVNAGIRLAEAYVALVGGSTDSNNRPLFFQWNRVTGVLTSSQVHSAGTSGATGFKIIAPTGGAGESGGNLWTLSRNDLLGFCHNTTANCTLTLGSGGTSSAAGIVNLMFAGTTRLSLYPISATTAELDIGGSATHYFFKGAGGGATGGGLGIGTSDNSAALNIDMTSNLTGSLGLRIKQKASSSVNIVDLQNSSAVSKFQITSAFNVVIGSAAIATTATDGFLYIPTMAGTPTGNSTDYPGMLPIVYDTSANKLWINTTGTTWLGVVLAPP